MMLLAETDTNRTGVLCEAKKKKVKRLDNEWRGNHNKVLQPLLGLGLGFTKATQHMFVAEHTLEQDWTVGHWCRDLAGQWTELLGITQRSVGRTYR